MYDMVVNKPTHLSGSLLDEVHILKSFVMESNISSDIHNVYFSDYNAVKIHFQWSFYMEYSFNVFVVTIEFETTVVVDLHL